MVTKSWTNARRFVVTPSRSAESPNHRRRSLTRQRLDLRLMAADFVMIGVASYSTLPFFGGLPDHAYWTVLLSTVVAVIAIDLLGLYERRITLSAMDDAARLAAAVIVARVTASVIFNTDQSIRGFVGYLAVTVAGLVFMRALYYAGLRALRRRHRSMRSRTLVIGNGSLTARLMTTAFDNPQLGIEPMLVLDTIDSSDAIRNMIAEHDITTVIVSFGAGDTEMVRAGEVNEKMVSALRACDEVDCEIYVVPRTYQFTHLNRDMDRLHTVPLFRVRRGAQRSWTWGAKRVFDMALASLMLVLLAPLYALVALIIKAGEPKAPIIFKQVRIGAKGKEFTLLKFRSMKPVPASQSDVDWSPEKRITWFGKFIRKFSVDELPQLWNVARGDMSFVGPRPERPHFVEQFSDTVPSYRDRHRTVVGLTSWAAVQGLRGDTSIDDRALYDNLYIENWNVWLDMKIVLLTIGVVLTGKGS